MYSFPRRRLTRTSLFYVKSRVMCFVVTFCYVYVCNLIIATCTLTPVSTHVRMCVVIVHVIVVILSRYGLRSLLYMYVRCPTSIYVHGTCMCESLYTLLPCLGLLHPDYLSYHASTRSAAGSPTPVRRLVLPCDFREFLSTDPSVRPSLACMAG